MQCTVRSLADIYFFVELCLVDLVVDEPDLVVAVVEQVLGAPALGVEVAVVDAQVAEHLLLPRTHPQLSIPENQIVRIVGHAADHTRLARVSGLVGEVPGVVEPDDPLPVQREDQCLLVHYGSAFEHSGVVGSHECALSFDDDDEVGVVVDELVEVGLLVPGEGVEQVGGAEFGQHVLVDAADQEALLAGPRCQDLSVEEHLLVQLAVSQQLLALVLVVPLVEQLH